MKRASVPASLFSIQVLVALLPKSWLGAQPFAHSWWAYSFGVASGTLACVKLALAGVSAAHALALPMFAGANLFIGYLCVRSLALFASTSAAISS